jgi:hypothetical protein
MLCTGWPIVYIYWASAVCWSDVRSAAKYTEFSTYFDNMRGRIEFLMCMNCVLYML